MFASGARARAGSGITYFARSDSEETIILDRKHCLWNGIMREIPPPLAMRWHKLSEGKQQNNERRKQH
jgi:hypothetical protein